MTSFPDLFAALAASFDSHEIRIRTQGDRKLHYITARTAMNRLDEVLGPENWWDEYVPGENSVLCRLTIKLPDGTTITKQDAGGYAGMSDSGDDDKSGFSDAFKRAAAKFGVARYLYRDGVPQFVRERDPSVNDLPQVVYQHAEPSIAASGRTETRDTQRNAPRDTAPKTGRSLFAWTKDQEERHFAGLLRYLNNWAKLQDFPSRMVDWDAEQVELGYAEACRKIQARGPGSSEAYDEVIRN